MILGIGTDLLKINRLSKVIQKNPSVLKRLFTPEEILCAEKLSPLKRKAYYAKRFSGKEAISKACGTGIGKNIGWLDMEILNDKKGKPVVQFSPKAFQFLQKKFKTKEVFCFLSLTDEKEYAMAFVVLTN